MGQHLTSSTAVTQALVFHVQRPIDSPDPEYQDGGVAAGFWFEISTHLETESDRQASPTWNPIRF